LALGRGHPHHYTTFMKLSSMRLTTCCTFGWVAAAKGAANTQHLIVPACRVSGLSVVAVVQVPALRAAAVQLLAMPLGGDTLAAEYLLLQLLSR
jgi:hypothetical protein